MEHHIDYILEGCRKGDKVCKEELIKEVKPIILRAVNSFISHKHLREDLVQEGYIIALKSAETFEGSRGTCFFGYLKRALHYGLYHKVVEKEAGYYNRKIVSDDEDALMENLKQPGPSTEEAVVKKETIKALHQAIKSLEAGERMAVVDRYFKNIMLKDIGKREGISMHMMYYYQRHAMKKLKKMMENFK